MKVSGTVKVRGSHGAGVGQIWGRCEADVKNSRLSDELNYQESPGARLSVNLRGTSGGQGGHLAGGKDFSEV